MPKQTLPAIYTPPPAHGDSDIALVRDLLDIVFDVPSKRPVLLAAVTRILALGGGPGDRQPDLQPVKAAPAVRKPGKRNARHTAAAADDMPASPLKPRDIEVDQTADKESVTYRDKTMEILPDQALLIGALVTALPKPVSRKELQKTVYPKRKGDGGKFALNVLIGPTREALASVGIELRTLRGVGLGLWPAAAK